MYLTDITYDNIAINLKVKSHIGTKGIVTEKFFRWSEPTNDIDMWWLTIVWDNGNISTNSYLNFGKILVIEREYDESV